MKSEVNMVFKRNAYVRRLMSSRDNGFVKIITGVRRCGKSYLLFNLFKKRLVQDGVRRENIIEVKLDEGRNEKLRNPRALEEFVRRFVRSKRERYYAFIDEIQYCYEVPLADNPKIMFTFYDTLNGLMKIGNLDIYVTGSNSRLLSKDVATHFRDRGEEVQVHPLTFAEVHEAFKGDIYREWMSYLTFGGMPGALLKNTEEEKRRYLAGLFKTTYLRDIVERYNLKDDYALGRTVDIAASVAGSLTNPTKLAHAMQNELGVRISIPTVKNYLGYLEDAFLFRKADRFDVKGKRYLDYPAKYYAEDVGLRNARLNFRQIEPDHLMENVIFSELVARGADVDVGVVDTEVVKDGVRHRRQLEIDFIVNLGLGKIYIQSAYAMNSERKKSQETASLEKSGDSFRKLVVLGVPQPKYTDDNGITYVGVMDFLLDPSVLNALIA